jgi:hypothetical protein
MQRQSVVSALAGVMNVGRITWRSFSNKNHVHYCAHEVFNASTVGLAAIADKNGTSMMRTVDSAGQMAAGTDGSVYSGRISSSENP